MLHAIYILITLNISDMKDDNVIYDKTPDRLGVSKCSENELAHLCNPIIINPIRLLGYPIMALANIDRLL